MMNEELTVAHDKLSAVRFLQNLYSEIEHAKTLEEICDNAILFKFSKVIEFIQKEFAD